MSTQVFGMFSRNDCNIYHLPNQTLIDVRVSTPKRRRTRRFVMTEWKRIDGVRNSKQKMNPYEVLIDSIELEAKFRKKDIKEGSVIQFFTS